MKKPSTLILYTLTVLNAALYAQTDSSTLRLQVGAAFHGPAYHVARRPALFASMEYKAHRDITLGIYSTYYRYRLTRSHVYTAFTVGLRASYLLNHLFKRDGTKNQYYVGAGLGYFGFHYANLSGLLGQLYVPLYIGWRRTIGTKTGLFVEAAFNDVGTIKGGLLWRF